MLVSTSRSQWRAETAPEVDGGRRKPPPQWRHRHQTKVKIWQNLQHQSSSSQLQLKTFITSTKSESKPFSRNLPRKFRKPMNPRITIIKIRPPHLESLQAAWREASTSSGLQKPSRITGYGGRKRDLRSGFEASPPPNFPALHRPPQLVSCSNSSTDLKRGLRRRDHEKNHGLWSPDGGERSRRRWGGETGLGLKGEKKFPVLETSDFLIFFGKIPYIPKWKVFPTAITSSYELVSTCSYNFREGSFRRILTYEKSNFVTP